MKDKHKGVSYWVAGNDVILLDTEAVTQIVKDHDLPKPKLCWLGGLAGRDFRKRAQQPDGDDAA